MDPSEIKTKALEDMAHFLIYFQLDVLLYYPQSQSNPWLGYPSLNWACLCLKAILLR